ncbi:xanthine phosphoribosyltransferase [Paenibacillus yanchengensis]|uniref:Xanthine phosphoribosyltransferase n=1 Tax=Paenibacillus yanchengensis TaxID=2035833 RepID=A0ABW4YKM3_9BACL
MEKLQTLIKEEAIVISDQVIVMDTFLNHQVDPAFMMELGEQFASRFKEHHITKVITIESSGITVAFATALVLGVPLVFARRKKTLVGDTEMLVERVPSFTKGMVTDIMVSKQLLSETDQVLFIDDIIANGDAARGLIKIIERAGATLVGAGIVVEKAFQSGGAYLRESGIQVESLVKIASLTDGEVQFSS